MDNRIVLFKVVFCGLDARIADSLPMASDNNTSKCKFDSKIGLYGWRIMCQRIEGNLYVDFNSSR